MKKRTSRVSRRIVSLLMSMVLTLTLVTPAAFATEVVGGSGTAIIEGNANPADVNPNEDAEGKDDESKNTEDGKDEQPTNPGDEDKNPGEGEGDANKPAEDNKGEENPAEDKKDEVNKDEQPTEDENNGEDEIALLDAENGTDVWAGADAEDGIDTSWYTNDTTVSTFYISTAAQLAGLAKLVNEGNNFSKKTIQLTKDIRLNEQDVPTGGHEWTPIGNNKKKFQGTFDGDGHAVSGLYINEAKTHKGLFGAINSATVKNLIVTGSVNSGYQNNAGGIVGNSTKSIVQNCGFYGTVISTTKATALVGGVVGGGSKAINCWYYRTDPAATVLGVFGKTGSYCYQNVSKDIENNSKGIYAADFNSEEVVKELNKGDNVAAGKIWAVDEAEGAVYPKLIDPPKTITLKPIFPDCAATVSVNDTELNVNNDYTYEVTGDVTITASIEGICYGKEGATGNDLTPITSSGVSYTGPFPATLFYGTEDDFDALTAWNSALVGNTATINDAAALKALARMVNSGTVSTQGMTITLNEDIDLSGIKDWTPIGTDNYPFRGTFNGNKKTISNLAGDLFGVVEGGTIRQVSIDAGRMVRLLKSSSDWRKGGIVEYCRAINVNGDTASIDSLVGKIESVTVKNSAGKDMLIVSSVSSSYVYDSKKPGIPVVEAKDELSTVTNCFYLAETSTFGAENDTGARTAEEFAAGRVTWELNGKADGFKGRNTYLSWGMSDNEPKVPKLARIKVGAPGCVYELTLTKVYAPPAKDIRLEGGEGVTVFQNGDTWYAYCVLASNKTFSVKVDTTTLESGDMVTYGTNGEPTKITRIEASAEAAKNAYFYTIGGKIEADIDWYVGNKDEKTYTLRTAAEMFGFAALVNGTAKDKNGSKISENFNDKTVELDNDIDLSGYSWTPIGLGNGSVFQGTFDGGGHRIKGLFVTSNMQYAGLFGYLKGGTVQKVQVEGSIDATYTSGGDFFVGGIVGYLEGAGTVSNCLSKVDVTATSSNKAVSAGGVVGFAVSGSKINLCWNEGSVQVTGVVVGSAVGGVVGGAATATNCANFGAVTSNCATGGIAGSINEASNCYNLGTVTGAEGMTHNISGGTAVNSYYADIAGKTGIYVKRGSDTTKAATTGITITEDENGKLTYKVTMDGTEYDLVVVLNENTPTAANIEKWINKLSTPYNPVHMTRWDGNPEPGAQEGVVSITYDPGTATVGTAVSDSKLLKEEEASWTFTLKTADDLGFKHENGTFLGWSTQSDAAVPEYTFGGEAPTITVTKEQKNVILYAVWKNIWSGDGSKDSPYQISDAEKLTALQTQVNDEGFNYKGKYFALTPENKTIALTGKWTPIGNGKASFAGSIEGNGNTITGLYVTEETRAGLFEILGVDGTSTYIRNLTICGQVTVDHGHAGGLTAVMGHGTITLEKITTDVTVRVENLNYYASPLGSAGGLIGYNVANNGAAYNVVKVIKCINKGSIYGVTAGGIAGANNSSNAANQYTLEDCTNEGTVTGLLYAGGILGGSTNSTATRCENSGTVKATETTGTRGYAGGICATNLRWAERCVNTGNVSGKYAGGIAYGLSSTYGGEAKYCLNKGNITGTRIAAGIAVYGKKADISGIGGVSFSYNLGEIKGSTDAYSYGIAQGGTIKNCFTYNEAKHVAISANNKLVTNSYYLADSAGDFPATYGGERASADDFTSGKVAWGVDGGTGDHAGWWTQDTTKGYPKLLPAVDKAQSYYRAQATCGTGGTVTLDSSLGYTSTKDADNAVYGPKDTSVTIKATPKDNTFGLKSLTWTHNGQTDVLPTKGTTNIVMPAESNVTIHAEFASVGPGGNGGYYYGGSGDGTGTGDKDDEGLQDGLNMDVEYDIKGLVLGAYAEWGSNGGNKSFQKWLEENPNVVRALLTNSLDNMATAAVGKKTDEAKDLAALLLASLNEHTGVDGKNGDTIAKALQKYIDSGSEEVFSAWLTGGGGMASGTYESIYGQYASSLAALADRLYSKWEASGTSMTFPVWLDSQQVSMDSLSENADEPDTDNTNDPQTSDAPDDVPDGQDTEGGASGNSVWEIIGTVVRENPILVWSIVAVIAALIIVGAVRRYHKVKRDEHDEK